MTIRDQVTTTRRRFLATGAAAAVGAATLAQRLEAAGEPAAPNPDGWLDQLRGDDRLLLDSPDVKDATLLYYILHFYGTHRRDYGHGEGQVAAVGALYGPTTPFALDDATWARQRLGEYADIRDPETGALATRNPWRRTPLVRGTLMPEASLERLQASGATFLICDLALQGLSGRIAEARGGSAEALHEELRRGVLPGLVLVPNVVVSIQRAQRRGLPYYRL